MSPRNISSFALLEKNKLTSSTVWLVMLEITIPGVAIPIRITSNNESVTWREESWIAFPFELDDISEESKGEVPQVTLRVSNVSRVMESYLQDFDLYTKTSGYSPIEVKIYVVNNQGSFSSGVVTDTTSSGAVTDTGSAGALTDELYDIANPDPEVEHVFELMNPKTTSMWATFTLGAANPFRKRFPQSRLLKNHCRFIFKDAWCKYASGETLCDKTLTRCRALSNSINFGGFPGVGTGGIKVA
jgi:phage-related protein